MKHLFLIALFVCIGVVTFLYSYSGKNEFQHKLILGNIEALGQSESGSSSESSVCYYK